MLRHIKLLTVLETRNLFGLNVLFHTHDKRARWKALALAFLYALVAALLCFYVGGLAWGLAALGLSDVVPAYLMVIAAMVVFFFGIFKAGSALFSQKGLDALCALPVPQSAIVVGRFARMYLEDLALSLAVFLPGFGVYAFLVRPGVLFYPLALLAALGTPLIPLTLATLVGAVITGLTARMKHKSLGVAALSLLAAGGIMILSFSLTSVEDLDLNALRDLSGTVLTLLGKVYPPALWMGTALVRGDLLPALLWLGASLGLFVLMALAVSSRFQAICRRLAVNSAKHDYRLTAQKGSSLTAALCRRELRRYFASAGYVTNTIVGPVMGVALAVALFFADLETMFPPALLPFDIKALIPFVLAWPFCIMSPTAVSVSLEGKNLWIAQSLPLSNRDFLGGKLLFALLLNLPFLLLAVVLSILALGAGWEEALWLLLFPLLLLLLVSVLGLFVNLHLPSLNWENETRVVKQSAASMTACFIGMALPILCALAAVFFPFPWVRPALCALLLLLTLILWQVVCRYDLKKLA